MKESIMKSKFNIRREWRNESTGRVLTVTAVSPTGRVLAVVNVEIPVQVGVDLEDRFGAQVIDDVIKSAEANVTSLANGLLKEGKKP
jgi:hypothetical protein